MPPVELDRLPPSVPLRQLYGVNALASQTRPGPAYPYNAVLAGGKVPFLRSCNVSVICSLNPSSNLCRVGTVGS
jgi:hypothetical protein